MTPDEAEEVARALLQAAALARSESADPVRRLTREEILARADAVARDILQTTREDAFARLERGELDGTLAEPELRILRDMLNR